MRTFELHESRVRNYSCTWPIVFNRAEGSWIYSEDGRRYLDFFAGAGALNYGHNNDVLRQALVKHLASGGVVHSLDMATTSRRAFIECFVARILRPRELDYRIQFPGPAGTTAVEAALRLARKATGRPGVLFFEGGFHGMTLGSRSVSDGSTAALDSRRYRTRRVPFATDAERSIAELAWADSDLACSTAALGQEALEHLRAALDPVGIPVRGRGLAIGVELPGREWANRVSRAAFEAGLLVETCGTAGQVVKLIPPLTITPRDLRTGLDILISSVTSVQAHPPAGGS